MHYKFPEIRHLDEVRAAIEGATEFVIAEREWGYVVNYLVMTPDAFPEVVDRKSAIRRECRGIAFDRAGNLISRPLHKFFGVNQIDETQAGKIDLSRPHVILDKLDGSMVRPIPMGDGYRLGTKMGPGDVSDQAERWLVNHPNYDEFFRACIKEGYTPVMEWMSRQQKIVVDHPNDRLVLLAVRTNLTGAYMGMVGMRKLADAYQLEMVSEYEGTANNMQALLSETKDLEGSEGWIIRFDDGQMVKMKSDWYLARHHAKDAIGREKDTIAMLLADQLDDVKPVLSPFDRHLLEEFERAFWRGVDATVMVWLAMDNYAHARHGNDRKSFALSDEAKTMDGNLKSFIFKVWDQEGSWAVCRQAVIDTIAKNLGTQTKVNSVRTLFGGARWDYATNTGDE